MDKAQLAIIIRQILLEIEKTERMGSLPYLAYLPFQEKKKLEEITKCYESQYNVIPWQEMDGDVLLVEELSVDSVGRLANAVAINETEKIIIKHLLENKPLWVAREFAILKNSPMAKQVYKNVDIIKSYGVEFLTSYKPVLNIDLTTKRLLTEKDFINIPKNSKVMVSNPILTPSAKDKIRERNITLENSLK